MNIFLWMLAGGIAGWIGFPTMKFNEDRGVLVSITVAAGEMRRGPLYRAKGFDSWHDSPWRGEWVLEL